MLNVAVVLGVGVAGFLVALPWGAFYRYRKAKQWLREQMRKAEQEQE